MIAGRPALLWFFVFAIALAAADRTQAAVATPAYTDTQIRLIAVCPGVAIHGLGHLAAGDPSTARWLFIAETAGYAAMFTAGARGRVGLDRSTPRAIAFGTGAALFLGSWIYDILAAPSAPRTTAVGVSLDATDRGTAHVAVMVPLSF